MSKYYRILTIPANLKDDKDFIDSFVNNDRRRTIKKHLKESVKIISFDCVKVDYDKGDFERGKVSVYYQYTGYKIPRFLNPLK